MYLKGESMKKLKLDAYDVPAFITGTNDYYDVTEGEYIYHTIIGVDEMSWIHTNIWGCPYEIKTDEGRVAVYWIEEEGLYKRIILPYFINLQYDDHKVTSSWGNPDVIVIGDNYITLNYGYCDKVFSNKEKMERDIVNPSEFNFTQFCNEIFGDG